MKKTLILLALLLSAAWAEATLTLSQGFGGGAIADGNPVGVGFGGTFTAANPLDQVLGVTINLNINGGYNGDLYAYLIAPNGTLVVLMDQPGVGVNGFGAYGSGLNNLTLSDAGSTGIQGETSGSILTGTYQAAGSLSAFNGSAANGPWTLFFADLASGGGTAELTGWTLNLTVVPEPVELALGLFAAMLLALAALKRICRPGQASGKVD